MITMFYAALAALLYVALSFYVIEGRYRYKISLGDGGHEAMARRIRVHANFIEYVPFALLLLLLLDVARMEPVILHTLGIMLLLGRILHIWAVARSGGPSIGRVAGMALTLLMMIIASVLLLWHFAVVLLRGFY